MKLIPVLPPLSSRRERARGCRHLGARPYGQAPVYAAPFINGPASISAVTPVAASAAATFSVASRSAIMTPDSSAGTG